MTQDEKDAVGCTFFTGALLLCLALWAYYGWIIAVGSFGAILLIISVLASL